MISLSDKSSFHWEVAERGPPALASGVLQCATAVSAVFGMGHGRHGRGRRARRGSAGGPARLIVYDPQGLAFLHKAHNRPHEILPPRRIKPARAKDQMGAS